MPANSLAQTESKCGRKPSSPFTPPQQQALRDWNGILSSLNSEIIVSLSPQQIADNRIAAFQLFVARHGGDGEDALLALAGAFKSTHGHWVNGEPPTKSIPLILAHMNDSLLKSSCGITYYRSNTAKMESRPRPASRGKQAVNTFCLAHPDRKAISHGMCSSCYAKAWKLNLLHLPLSKWLVTLLQKRKPRDARQCVNHAKVHAYADGLCVECLREVGKLEGILGIEEVCYATH